MGQQSWDNLDIYGGGLLRHVTLSLIIDIVCMNTCNENELLTWQPKKPSSMLRKNTSDDPEEPALLRSLCRCGWWWG